MKFLSKAVIILGLGSAVISSGAQAFGKPGTWVSGWGQGVSEYLAVSNAGNKLMIACSMDRPVSMTLEAGGREYGSYSEGDFDLIIDGEEVQTPYETASRVGANNFYYTWDALRAAKSIVAVTSDGLSVELPSSGSAKTLPAWQTPSFTCTTEF